MEENVVQMPSVLDRLAGKLKILLSREANNRQEWIDIQMDKCLILTEMRGQFSANIAFGRWCDENGFDKTVINHQTRAAAIEMGKNPEALRACLEATKSSSLEQIYLKEFDRFTDTRKTTKPKKRGRRPTKEPREMVNEVRRRLDAGQPMNKAELGRTFGLGKNTVERAMLEAQVESELRTEPAPSPVEPLKPAEMSSSMRERYEAALRTMRKEIRAEERAAAEKAFQAQRDELHKRYDLYIKQHAGRLAVADKLLNNYAGILTEQEFNTIRNCLHPDSRMRDATEAFQIFNEKKPMLVKVVAYSGPPLPQTAADLLRQRKNKR